MCARHGSLLFAITVALGLAACSAKEAGFVVKEGGQITAPYKKIAEFNVGYQRMFKCFNDAGRKPHIFQAGRYAVLYDELGEAEYAVTAPGTDSYAYLLVRFIRIGTDKTRIMAYESSAFPGGSVGMIAEVWPMIKKCGKPT